MVKHRGDDICGVLLLDKPTGRSSNHVLQQIKRLFNAKKAGHTGSLDPLATGLLPICFGKATCLSQYFLHSDKQYETIIQFGVSTDSHDSDGDVTSTREVVFSVDQFQSALDQFKGAIEQIPPMVSALKHKGQPLYKLALKGQEIERKPRSMTVYGLTGELLNDNRARINVHCSSGFYVRQLAADLGEVLGCGAHVVELRRTASKYLSVENALLIEQVETLFAEKSGQSRADMINAGLIAPDELLKSLPFVSVDASQAHRLAQGQTIRHLTQPDADTSYTEMGQIKVDNIRNHCRVYQNDTHFLGIGDWNNKGTLKMKNRFNDVLL